MMFVTLTPKNSQNELEVVTVNMTTVKKVEPLFSGPHDAPVECGTLLTFGPDECVNVKETWSQIRYALAQAMSAQRPAAFRQSTQ